MADGDGLLLAISLITKPAKKSIIVIILPLQYSITVPQNDRNKKFTELEIKNNKFHELPSTKFNWHGDTMYVNRKYV